jgi:hypothetical protein
MKTIIALERAKTLDTWVRALKQGGSVTLDATDIPLLEEIKRTDDEFLKRYPKLVETRHNARFAQGSPYWRTRNSIITDPLLEQVTGYLEQQKENR